MIRAALAALALCLAAGPVRAVVDIQEVTSPGGLTAWLVEDHEIPFVALEIRFRGGTSLDPDGARGAVNLMAALLEEGAGERDARAYAAAREDIAASIDFDAGRDSVSVSSRFLTETTDTAATLIREALVAPRFDDSAVERVRSQVLSNIRASNTDPGDIAGDRFAQTIYGDHPYATNQQGTTDSVEALTRDDLVAAHDRTIARDRIYIAAAGDITPERLGTLIDEILGEVPAEGAPLPGPAPVTAGGGTDVVDLDVPQSVALFGHEGIERDDPDYFAAYVANEIFGGAGRQSRLTEEVREARGLTYGIGTYLVDYDHADLLLGQFATRNDGMAEAIDVVRDQWARMASEGATEAELETIKTYLTGAYPLRFDGNGTIANILVGMQMTGLPIDYVTTRNDRVEAVTREDVARVAERLYHPENLSFVVVGRPSGLDGEATQ